jgi:hypothetical protein
MPPVEVVGGVGVLVGVVVGVDVGLPAGRAVGSSVFTGKGVLVKAGVIAGEGMAPHAARAKPTDDVPHSIKKSRRDRYAILLASSKTHTPSVGMTGLFPTNRLITTSGSFA